MKFILSRLTLSKTTLEGLFNLDFKNKKKDGFFSFLIMIDITIKENLLIAEYNRIQTEIK